MSPDMIFFSLAYIFPIRDSKYHIFLYLYLFRECLFI